VQKFIRILSSLQIVHVYSCSVEPLVIDHIISGAAASKTGVKHKLLSIQEKLNVIKTVKATENFCCRKSLSKGLHFYVNCKY